MEVCANFVGAGIARLQATDGRPYVGTVELRVYVCVRGVREAAPYGEAFFGGLRWEGICGNI